jgi:cytochrome P450
MLPLIAALLAAVFVALMWYHAYHAVGSHSFPQQLRAFKALPVLGNALEVLRCMPRLHDAIAEMTAKCGYRTWAFSVPFMPTYWVVTSPENLEYILKTKSNNFIKGKTFKSNLGQILGRGIFAVDGQEWYWQRKLAAHIFNVRR